MVKIVKKKLLLIDYVILEIWTSIKHARNLTNKLELSLIV